MTTVKGVKLVVVGDDGIGKTCMLTTYATDKFPEDSVPSTWDGPVKTMTAGEDTYELGLWDTRGDSNYDKIRVLGYANADVIFICFSISSRSSFEHIDSGRSKWDDLGGWAPEMNAYCPDVPKFLVGTKSDLRSEADCVASSEGEAKAKQMGAVKYLECSALTGDNLKVIFDEVMKCAIFGTGKGKKKKSNNKKKSGDKRCILG